jgi:hypothetical protein
LLLESQRNPQLMSKSNEKKEEKKEEEQEKRMEVLKEPELNSWIEPSKDGKEEKKEAMRESAKDIKLMTVRSDGNLRR